jgi:sugar O-acyltransferase (sialic acid O-acetyltransferase NeuD family)
MIHDTDRHIIFWGATGQAKVLRECMESQGWKVVALFDNNSEIISPLNDVPIYYGRSGFEWWQANNQTNNISFIVAIGGDRGKDRLEIQNYLIGRQLLPTITQHSTAFVASGVKIGVGSQILAHATVCVDSIIGESSIINTSASVDHECKIGNGVHICPGVKMAGCIEVEDYVTIGTGAIILPRIKVGTGAIIGAGAVVIRDVMPHTVVVGNPAKVIRSID